MCLGDPRLNDRSILLGWPVVQNVVKFDQRCMQVAIKTSLGPTRRISEPGCEGECCHGDNGWREHKVPWCEPPKPPLGKVCHDRHERPNNASCKCVPEQPMLRFAKPVKPSGYEAKLQQERRERHLPSALENLRLARNLSPPSRPDEVETATLRRHTGLRQVGPERRVDPTPPDGRTSYTRPRATTRSSRTRPRPGRSESWIRPSTGMIGSSNSSAIRSGGGPYSTEYSCGRVADGTVA